MFPMLPAGPQPHIKDLVHRLHSEAFLVQKQIYQREKAVRNRSTQYQDNPVGINS